MTLQKHAKADSPAAQSIDSSNADEKPQAQDAAQQQDLEPDETKPSKFKVALLLTTGISGMP